MIDIKLLREQPDLVRDGLRKKHADASLVDKLLAVDLERLELRKSTEAMQAEQNQFSLKMAQASPEEKEALRGQLKELSDRIKSQKSTLQELDGNYVALMRQIPNLPHPDVPEGASDKENVLVRSVGEKPVFAFEPKDHEVLTQELDLVDMERAAKVSGAKFYYLKNELVILEMALLRFALDILKSKGFILLSTPDLVRTEAMYGAGHFSAKEDEISGDAYQLERDGLYLAGTAEVALANFHAGEILREADLPLRYAGISACFRREAGTYGKETRGLYRVHQFNKVEMFSYTRPQDSEKEHELLLSIHEDLLQKLELPYQVVLNCGGDLGTPQAKKWDVEAWMAGMNKYGETCSASNDTDYQARSLAIRYRPSGPGGEKETRFLHTLNCTAFASPRILIPILENNQQEDGSIRIPEVLIPYTGFAEIRRRD